MGICAPSGAFDKEKFDQGVEILSKMGFSVYIPSQIYEKKRYLAGTDRSKVDVIHQLFLNPSIKGIFCARGGYGALRILKYLDYQLIASHPKLFVGFSDITALLVTFSQRCAMGVVHGPVVTSLGMASQKTLISFFQCLTGRSHLMMVSPLDLGEAVSAGVQINTHGLSPTTSNEILDMPLVDNRFQIDAHGLAPTTSNENSDLSLADNRFQINLDNAEPYVLNFPNAVVLRDGHAEGELIGGNLATLCHLAGTRFQPDFRDTILFLEEINEPPYKIDRMLTQMKLSGMLDGIRGLLLGSFINCGGKSTIEEIILELFDCDTIPIVAGVAVGHGEDNLPLRMGITVEMDTFTRCIRALL